MLPDHSYPAVSSRSVTEDFSLAVAVLLPGTDLDDLIAVLRKEAIQCLDVTQYDPAADYAELLQYGLSGAGSPIGILFVLNKSESRIVYDAAGLGSLARRLPALS